VARKAKKDFDKDQMYSKIMPSIVTVPPQTQVEQAPPQRDDALEADYVQQQYVLRNFMEDIVMDKLNRTMTMLRCCECERCKKDVMAYALNELPSAYMVTEPQELEANVKQLRKTYEIKVTSALIQAVQKVKACPNHKK
jgi:competence protein ComFB